MITAKKSLVRSMQTKSLVILGLSGMLGLSLQACVPVAIVGVVGGAAMVGLDRRTVGTQTMDKGIAIETESLVQRAMITGDQINVTVFNRKVMLTGQVPNEEEKLRIENIVKTNSNVQAVYNYLMIAPSSTFTQRNQDTYITTKVKTVLTTTKGVPTNSMRIFTENGVVYLMGLVTEKEGQIAAQNASTVGDVRQVVKVFDYISESEREKLELERRSTDAATSTK